LFGEDTAALPSRLLSEGYEAVVTSVDSNRLPADFCGRKYDASFLRDLPEGVDLCGERGEFHSFVFNAPYFSTPVAYAVSGFRDLRFEDPRHPFACRVCDLRVP
jgi:diphthamide synthase (EF-2-diphthine--ammonia ligase)